MNIRPWFAVLALAPWTAMAERFDVVTFETPPGWTQQALGDGLMLEQRPAGTRTFCQIFLRKSRRTAASLPQELDRDWLELLGRQEIVAAVPDPDHLDLPNGITIAQRVGQAPAGGTLIVMLNLLQKEDRLVPVVVNLGSAEALDLCGPAIGDFIADLQLDTASATPASADSQLPTTDPTLAARFGNSVVGTWRYALTSVNVTLNAPTQVRNVIELRFARDGTYNIAVDVSIPGSGRYSEAEAGAYQVEGQRILMRPTQSAGKEPYALDWFFGDHPEFRGNWGLILRSSSDWLGNFNGLPARWRTFKPPE
jgi:hypothetical protein